MIPKELETFVDRCSAPAEALNSSLNGSMNVQKRYTVRWVGCNQASDSQARAMTVAVVVDRPVLPPSKNLRHRSSRIRVHI